MISKDDEQDLPHCAHCNQEMLVYDLPPINFSDGLGWNSKFLYICSNDDCPIFRAGFDHVMRNYAQASSLRYIVEPDSMKGSVIPAASLDIDHYREFLKFREENRDLSLKRKER